MSENSQRKSILILGINYAPEIVGIAPYTTGFAEALSNNGFRVSVITSHPHYPEWKKRKLDSHSNLNGVNLKRIWHYVPRKPFGLRRAISEISFGLASSLRFWGKPDKILIVTPALFSAVIALLKSKILSRKVPIVLWVQDLYALGIRESGSESGRIASLVAKLEKWAFQESDLIVVIHDRFKSLLTRDYGVPEAKIFTSRNWSLFDIETNLRSRDLRQSLGWKIEDFVVLHTGNMGLKQGLDNVFEAAKLALTSEPNLKFEFFGDGNQRERLIAQYGHLSNIAFRSSVDKSIYPILLASADCLILNELRGVAEMAVPSKLTSYFSSGTPVVASTDLGGIAAEEVAKSGSGIVVESGMPELLLEALVKLMNDSRLRQGFQGAGHAYVSTTLNKSKIVTPLIRAVEDTSTT